MASSDNLFNFINTMGMAGGKPLFSKECSNYGNRSKFFSEYSLWPENDTLPTCHNHLEDVFLPPMFQEYMFLNAKFIPEFKNVWNLESSFLALLHLIHAMPSLLIGTKVKDVGLLGIVLMLNDLF